MIPGSCLRRGVGCGPFEFNTTHVRSLGVAAHLCLASETGPGPVTLEGECWNPTFEMYKNMKIKEKKVQAQSLITCNSLFEGRKE